MQCPSTARTKRRIELGAEDVFAASQTVTCRRSSLCSGTTMAGKHLRTRSIAVLEVSTCDKNNDEVDKASSIKDNVVIQEAETDGSVVTSESEVDNSVSNRYN